MSACTNVTSDHPTRGDTIGFEQAVSGLLPEVVSMRTGRTFAVLAASACLCAFLAYGQDSQSLGDVARQARLQKQQKDVQAKETAAKDAQTKDAHGKETPGPNAAAKDAQPPKPPRIITNEEISEHVGSTTTSARGSQPSSTPDALSSSGNRDARAEQWRSQIQEQKSAIASLQGEIASLSESIQYAGGNCVANCVQWNERQKQKQDQVESMKAQLEEQQKRLEEMQESARKQGFGSSVYDP